MDYHYINTDANAFEYKYSPHKEWIKHHHAFTSGNGTCADYKEYGEKALGELNPGDICFMYVSAKASRYVSVSGVVAAGRVCEPWNRCSYTRERRLVYHLYERTEYTEYCIRVHWYRTIVDNPINPNDLKDGWCPRKTRQRITNTDFAKALLGEIESR